MATSAELHNAIWEWFEQRNLVEEERLAHLRAEEIYKRAREDLDGMEKQIRALANLERGTPERYVMVKGQLFRLYRTEFGNAVTITPIHPEK